MDTATLHSYVYMCMGITLVYLQITQIRNADGAKDIAMRQLLYSMLVLDGDQSAHKVYNYTICAYSVIYTA